MHMSHSQVKRPKHYAHWKASSIEMLDDYEFDRRSFDRGNANRVVGESKDTHRWGGWKVSLEPLHEIHEADARGSSDTTDMKRSQIASAEASERVKPFRSELGR